LLSVIAKEDFRHFGSGEAVVYYDEMRVDGNRRGTRLTSDSGALPSNSAAVGEESSSIGSIGRIAGFVFAMTIIGAGAAFATHAYKGVVAHQLLQTTDTQELRAAIRRLEISVTRRMHELQSIQQQADQVEQTTLQRLLEQIALQNRELEKLTKTQSAKKQTPSAKPSPKPGSAANPPAVVGDQPADGSLRAPASTTTH
jgi:hypothetical protein